MTSFLPDRQRASATSREDEPTPARRQLWLTAFTRRGDFGDYLRAFGTEKQVEKIPEVLGVLERQQVRLERTGRGAAEPAQTEVAFDPVPAQYRPLLDAYAAEQGFKRAFPEDDWRYGLVRVDGLIVLRNRVDLDYVDRLAQSFAETPPLQTLIQVCLSPTKHPGPVEHMQVSDSVHEFRSPNRTFRFLGSAVRRLDPADLRLPTRGLPQSGIIAFVGVDTPPVSVARTRHGLALLNGLHRALAIRSAGARVIPVVVRGQNVVDVFGDAATGDLSLRDVDTLRRPPLLRDFLDAEMTTTVAVKPSIKILRLTINIAEVAGESRAAMTAAEDLRG